MKPISKSKFTSGINCKKSYYRKRKKIIKEEYSPSQLLKFRQGRIFESYIHKLFPHGINIDKERNNYSDKITYTSELIKTHKTPLFEAALSTKYEGIPLFCMIDILVPKKDGWEIYEIKSSTKVKKYHYEDLAFQYFTAIHSGLKIKSAKIIHLNSSYVREGDIIVKDLCAFSDITEQVILFQKKIPNFLKDLVLVDNNNSEPDINIGKHCIDPYDCPFKDIYCWKGLDNNNVFNFLGKKTASDLYNSGVFLIDDIPLDIKSINYKKRKMLKLFKSRKTYYNPDKIKVFLKKLIFPLYYFDFETFSSPIPLYSGISPYKPIPFQYSIHLQKDQNRDCKHIEYLAPGDGKDPRYKLVHRLLNDLGESGSIIVYHKSFEKSRLQDLALWFPELADKLNNCIERLIDLEDVFKNIDIYSPKMLGSSSIKFVLPAFTKLSYADQECKDGSDAMNIFTLMQENYYDKVEYNNKKKALLEYCKLDTLAMVELMAVLYQFRD